MDLALRARAAQARRAGIGLAVAQTRADRVRAEAAAATDARRAENAAWHAAARHAGGGGRPGGPAWLVAALAERGHDAERVRAAEHAVARAEAEAARAIQARELVETALDRERRHLRAAAADRARADALDAGRARRVLARDLLDRS